MFHNFTKYSDQELLNFLTKKDRNYEPAFKEMYRRYAGDIHAYSLKILGNYEKAQDIFQDTFMIFSQNINPDYANVNVLGYLIKICRNLCLNEKRIKKDFVDIDTLNFLSDESRNYDREELLELINTAIDVIEPEYKEAFVLREYNNLSYLEISETLDITLANAKSRVFRAKQKIRTVLKPYLNEINK